MKKGFTLIELLVVVLIIGILAAIAVPQYQKAVLKSRYSSLMPTAKAIRDGQEIYYMTNNQYADEIAKLDVKTANTEDMTLDVDKGPDYAYTFATRGDLKNNLIMYQKHSIQFPGEIHCEAREDDAQAKWLCETALHAVKDLGEGITPNYKEYVIEGTGKGKTVAEIEAEQTDPEDPEDSGETGEPSSSNDPAISDALLTFAKSWLPASKDEISTITNSKECETLACGAITWLIGWGADMSDSELQLTQFTDGKMGGCNFSEQAEGGRCMMYDPTTGMGAYINVDKNKQITEIGTATRKLGPGDFTEAELNANSESQLIENIFSGNSVQVVDLSGKGYNVTELFPALWPND